MKTDPLNPGRIPGQNPETPERLPGHTAAVRSDPTGNEEELGGRPAFLFRSGTRRGVTLDSSGANLPPTDRPWILARYITLGVRDVGFEGTNPEPVIRGIEAQGYYCWDLGNPAPGEGTSQ